MASTFNARDAAVYERSMGRWSRRLSPGFVAFAGLQGGRVLDVGCGTGSLLLELAAGPAFTRIDGIDASAIYAAAAAAKFHDTRVVVQHADAYALPFPDYAFDAALSQLVLQFVPEPERAAAEMRRVVRPGGTIAACVWNSGGGMPHQRMFWDTAAVSDPEAARQRARTFSRPMTRRGDLARLFATIGLRDVAEDSITIWMDFDGFEDFWDPIAGGEGTLGRYVAALPPDQAATLRRRLEDAFGPGPREFACTAAICRGITAPP